MAHYSSEKPENATTGEDAEAAPVNLKALKRRQDREKRERLGISRTKRQLPAFSLPETSEEEEEVTITEKGSDTQEEKRREAREKIKQVTLLMARDIQKWKIPKKKLKEMAKGKTEEETVARKRVLEMAWKIAKRQQQKEKEKINDVEKAKEKETVKDGGPKKGDGEGDTPKSEESKVDDKEEPEKSEKQPKEEKTAKEAETRRKAKGKERAPGWSSAPTAKPSK
jgi:putative cell wall-binding protein